MFRRHRRPMMAGGTSAVPWQNAQPVFRQEKKEREDGRRGTRRTQVLEEETE
jgi:hypothetical protein